MPNSDLFSTPLSINRGRPTRKRGRSSVSLKSGSSKARYNRRFSREIKRTRSNASFTPNLEDLLEDPGLPEPESLLETFEEEDEEE